MRVAALFVVLVLVFCLSVAVIPAYGKPAEEKGKFVKDGYVDVIIYGGPSAPQGKGAGVLAVKEKTAAAKVKEAEPAAQIFEEYRLINGVHAHIPVEAVDRLKRRGYSVEENKAVYLQLDGSGPVVNADKARRSYLNGNGTKVCILDTGIDFYHTQLKMPASNHVADFIKRLDGPFPTDAIGTLRSYSIYVNQSFAKLNLSINWRNTGNRFDMYVWYPNGTYAGGTNTSTPYTAYGANAGGTYWWLNVTLDAAPAGLYNITVNTTTVVDTSGEFFSVFWDPNNTQLGIIMSDKMGHGTHVAGIIAGNNSVYQGIAQGVDLYIGRVCSADGINNTCQTTDITNGMEWCVEQGADIMSLSVGGTASSNCNESMDIWADTAANTLLPVIAAGNAGSGGISSPGCARKVVGVGAVNDDGSIAGFSSRGPANDGQIKPDVVAPGVSINSTYPVNSFISFISMSGTSMATPHISAVAAIAKQANPTWNVPILKAALMATANKTRGGDHLDNDYGAGLVDAMMLVTKPYANVTTLHRGDPFAAYGRWLAAENNYTVQTITNSTNFTMNITVPPGTVSIKSVLYWEENSSDARSQMHLYLFDPAGDLADNSTIANSTVQMVYNFSPVAGQWKFNVSGADVQGTRQFVLFTSTKINSTSYAVAQINDTGNFTNYTAFADNDRTNYTGVTGSDWPLGAHQIKFYSNDTMNNWAASSVTQMTMFGWAGINESSAPTTVMQSGTNFTMACRVRDSNTSEVLQNYNVSFWADGNFTGSALTNSTGWANVTVSLNSTTYGLVCNITSNPAMLYDAAEKQATITLLKLNGQSCSVSSECSSGACCSGSCAASCFVPSTGGGGSGGSFTLVLNRTINITKNVTEKPSALSSPLPNVTQNITPPENKTEEIPQKEPQEQGNGRTLGLNVFFGTLTVVATVGWAVSTLKLRTASKRRR